MRKKILVKGPALSRSGYGEQTRFALRALRTREDLYDVYVMNIPWGHTGHISVGDERNWIDQQIIKTMGYIQQTGGNPNFDQSLQVTIPNEFECSPLAAALFQHRSRGHVFRQCPAKQS